MTGDGLADKNAVYDAAKLRRACSRYLLEKSELEPICLARINPSCHAWQRQTERYADQCGADSAHLLIFDRNPATPWDDKIYREVHSSGQRAITVWGM